ncbi:helix-turn-helix transcriptional regulator [Streptomyces sp. NPDC006207]
MPGDSAGDVGKRIATARRSRRMRQGDLAWAASLSPSMIQKIERGARLPSEDALNAIAAALALDPSRLSADGGGRANSRVRAALSDISAVIATYDLPDDGVCCRFG